MAEAPSTLDQVGCSRSAKPSTSRARRLERSCMAAASAAEGESMGVGRDCEISGGEIATTDVASGAVTADRGGRLSGHSTWGSGFRR